MSGWQLYNIAKHGLMSGLLDVGSEFVVSLHTSASNATAKNLETISEVTHECSSSGGYARKEMTGTDWRAVEGGFRLVASDTIWIAEGGEIADVTFAVASEVISGTLLAWMRLDNPVTIADRTALTISLVGGVIELLSVN
jgi:hypothetical protein